MRVDFTPKSVDYWSQFIEDQVGGGINVYSGVPYQRGAGIGSFFRSLFRMFKPVAIRAGKAIGKAALAGTANVASDLLQGKPALQSVESRAKETVGDLAQKAATAIKEGRVLQSGTGLGIRPQQRKRAHPATKSRINNIKAGAKKRLKFGVPADIFG